ncbi:MAG TPA: hypothetical protein VKZ57_16240 [Sphingobacterium sp.]|jgi:hypothetical protein|nr:hypothetical protein [Sphingobacterium sp.]
MIETETLLVLPRQQSRYMKENTMRIEKISMLGSDEEVVWEQDSDALKLHIPAGIQPDVPVYVFKVAMR